MGRPSSRGQLWQTFPFGNIVKLTKRRPQRTPGGFSERLRSEFRGCWVRPRHLCRHNLEIRKNVLKDVKKFANFLLRAQYYCCHLPSQSQKIEHRIFRCHASKSPCHDSHDPPTHISIAPWEVPRPMVWPTLGQHWRKRRAACPWGMPPTPETVRGRPRHPKIVLGRQRELGREMVPKNVVSGHQERGKRRKRGDQTVEEKYFPALAKQLLMVK